MPKLTYEDLPFVDEEFTNADLPPAEGMSLAACIEVYDAYHDLADRKHSAPVSFKGQWDGNNVLFWTGAVSGRCPGQLETGFVYLPEPPKNERELAEHRLQFANLAYDKAEREFEHAQQEALHKAGFGGQEIDVLEADLTAVAAVARWWAQAIDAIEEYLEPPVAPVVAPPQDASRERLLAVKI